MLAVAHGRALLVNRPASPPPTIGAAALVLLLGSPLLAVRRVAAAVAGVGGRHRAAGRGARAARRRRRERGRARRAPWRWLWRFGAATIAATAVTAPLVAHHFGEVAPAAPLGNLAAGAAGRAGRRAVRPRRRGAGRAVAARRAAAAARSRAWRRRLALAVAGCLSRARAGLAVPHAERVRDGRRSSPAACWRWAPARADGAGAARAGWRWLAARRWRWPPAAVSLGAREVARRSRSRPARHVPRRRAGRRGADRGAGRAVAADRRRRQLRRLVRSRASASSSRCCARAASTALDLVALSHPHPDHLNGLHRMLERFARRRAVDQRRRRPQPRVRAPAGDGARGAACRAAGARRRSAWSAGVAARRRSDRGVGRERIGAPPGLSVNDASLVLRARLRGARRAVPGDLEADGEGELVGRRGAGRRDRRRRAQGPAPRQPDLVDAPSWSTAVAPALAVISLGWQNRFHFPDAEVVARYAARGARVLRTDRDGAVTVTITPAGGVSVRCERGCP